MVAKYLLAGCSGREIPNRSEISFCLSISLSFTYTQLACNEILTCACVGDFDLSEGISWLVMLLEQLMEGSELEQKLTILCMLLCVKPIRQKSIGTCLQQAGILNC